MTRIGVVCERMKHRPNAAAGPAVRLVEKHRPRDVGIVWALFVPDGLLRVQNLHVFPHAQKNDVKC
jgi:hypothetical protein